jgi:hypothetical protein
MPAVGVGAHGFMIASRQAGKLTDLGFAAFGVDGGAGGFSFGIEGPEELGPGGAAVDVNGDLDSVTARMREWEDWSGSLQWEGHG